MNKEEKEEYIERLVEQGYSEQQATAIIENIEEDAEKTGFNFRDVIESAQGILEDIEIKLVSAVKNPAQFSEWVLMKSENIEEDNKEKLHLESPILLSKSETQEEKQIAYAPALVPGLPDRDGDIVRSETIEQSAHDFLKKGDIDAIDLEHDLNDGRGDIIESWVLKQDREFVLPDGEEKTYPKGTWMLGVQFDGEAWKSIKEGELTGFSIFGGGNQVALSQDFDNNILNKKLNIDNKKGDNMSDDEIEKESETEKEEQETKEEEQEKNAFEKLKEQVKAIDPAEVDFRNLDGLIADLMPDGITVADVSAALSDLREDFNEEDIEVSQEEKETEEESKESDKQEEGEKECDEDEEDEDKEEENEDDVEREVGDIVEELAQAMEIPRGDLMDAVRNIKDNYDEDKEEEADKEQETEEETKETEKEDTEKSIERKTYRKASDCEEIRKETLEDKETTSRREWSKALEKYETRL